MALSEKDVANVILTAYSVKVQWDKGIKK